VGIHIADSIGGWRTPAVDDKRRKGGGMKMKRTTYVLTVRAEPGVDDIRALRGWLKVGLRTFGLKCIGIIPKQKETIMDARMERFDEAAA
jgi:hypothetical protein